ncbi:MAG: hypothetical protein JXA90_01010, partial [Planctomycetes bacterium]|nr:hypothetical protein [Planctomycetota bacterium]
TPPFSETRLSVRPGHADLRAGESLRVEAEVEGRLPERATIHLSYAAPASMAFDGKAFAFTVSRPASDFSYRVAAGDAESELFRVRVRRPPEVKELAVAVESPEYTGWPPRRELRSSGNVSALKGSIITLEVLPTVALKAAALVTSRREERPFRRADERIWRLQLILERDIEYDFLLESADGERSEAGAVLRKLTAIEDRAPAVEILQPGRDLDREPTGAPVAVTLRASDDVGLREARIEWRAETGPAADGAAPGEDARGSPSEPGDAARGEDARGSPAEADGDAAAGGWSTAALWEFPADLKEAFPSAALDVERLLASAEIPPGSVERIVYRASATDRAGNRAHSTALRIRLLSEEEAAARRREELGRARAGLAEVLRREVALEREARELLGRPVHEEIAADAARLAREQDAIGSLGLDIVVRWDAGAAGGVSREVRRDVARAVRGLMPAAARDLGLAAEESPARRHLPLEGALRGVRRIIEILRRALELVEGDLRREGGVDAPDAAAADPARLRGVDEGLRRLLDDLDRFVKEQNDVLARTRELAAVDPDDFTAEEKAALDELIAVEEKWGRYLEEQGTDLSKVAPQDMSLATLLEEVVELVEEIDLAKGYLEGRNIELAVPLEQSGVELAEEIHANIERWMLRDRDRLKWVMEEPAGEFDVPLADLPSELEDIVGDLIDQEDLMTAETEDITSSWLDSLDEGIGWDIMDGPISNMSAKGATGNLQPNDMEIGGRAGEGRSGKSMGQFVEESAQGKGGRQTPTRSTPDPFEGGEVKDTGQDQTGGSTGGGKLSGAGERGLRGAPSPELERRMRALSGQQAKIRQQGEKLNLFLQRRRYYPQDLQRALDLMRRMEEELSAGRPYRYDVLRRRIAAELEAAGETFAAQRDYRIEAGAALPPRIEEELENAAGEEMPREYRDLIRDYYRSLAAGRGGDAPEEE